MSRYIDADKIFHIEVFDDGIDDYIKREMTVDEILDEFTDEGCSYADAVEVVRCKDCIHNDQCKHRVVMWVEDPINTWHKDIDFCSYGERKE